MGVAAVYLKFLLVSLCCMPVSLSQVLMFGALIHPCARASGPLLHPCVRASGPLLHLSDAISTSLNHPQGCVQGNTVYLIIAWAAGT